MKLYIISTLCSAFVVPGLGQVLNRELKKAIIILASIMAILVIGIIKISFIMKNILNEVPFYNLDSQRLIERLKYEDLTLIYALIIIFGIIWAYSIIDAFVTGLKLERKRQGDEDESISD